MNYNGALVNGPCARCGHTLYEHSTGECDLKDCTCKGWCATAWTEGHLPAGHRVIAVSSVRYGGLSEPADTDDSDHWAVGLAFAVFAVGLVIGVFIGRLLWGPLW